MFRKRPTARPPGPPAIRRSVARRRGTEPADFHVEVFDDGQALVVAPAGELDLATVPQVEAALGRITPAHRALIVNLARVSFVDSSAIRLLVETRRGPFGDRLAVVRPEPVVAHLFDLVGVASEFRWIGSPAEVLLSDDGRWRQGARGR